MAHRCPGYRWCPRPSGPGPTSVPSSCATSSPHRWWRRLLPPAAGQASLIIYPLILFLILSGLCVFLLALPDPVQIPHPIYKCCASLDSSRQIFCLCTFMTIIIIMHLNYTFSLLDWEQCGTQGPTHYMTVYNAFREYRPSHMVSSSSWVLNHSCWSKWNEWQYIAS